ncbi:MAG: diacylglycerol kinase family lipid kinase, partial [Acidobacteria bacterium]|nr:diacylglycerol kinase family lipid kinase [Acidobacteriota bacterium]
MKTAVIVNPHSAGGKTGRQWPEIAARIAARLGPVDARFTERPGHATSIARELLEQGYDRIVATGGDGTVNETANGFFQDDQPIRPTTCLGLIPLGTGGDFRRSLGIPNSIPEAIDILATASPRLIDVGKASYRTTDGGVGNRYFVNLLSFGMGGEVASGAKNFLTPLGGAVAFLWATAVALVRYRRKRVHLTLDGVAQPQPFSIYNVAVGN